MTKLELHPHRYFSPQPAQRAMASQLYEQVAGLPLVCPHGHVDPRLFADPDYRFGSPTELLLVPDHYIFRMLYSQGVPMADLGIPRRDGGPSETDPRRAWQRFADHFHLFRGTPTGIWLREEMATLFGVTELLESGNAQAIYDQIDAALQSDEMQPRRLYERFNIELLCTTDAATDTLTHHQAIRDSGWTGRILPTFRPDAVVDLERPGWRAQIDLLSEVSGIDVVDFPSYIRALEQRRTFFKAMGAHATDHAAQTAYTGRLSAAAAEQIFSRALNGTVDSADAALFTGHMLLEMARMSVEDGLVMQLHVGSYRNHNDLIFEQFGWDMGADIPLAAEFTRSLRPLLNEFGNRPEFNLILFNLDETTYSRELAPLAGHYPAVKLGPPWWFFDSLNGMRRFFDNVVETAGIYNTAGFNDDTRAYPSIPARHDVWRRAAADWVAGLVVRHIVAPEEGLAMVRALAYDLAMVAYKFV
ncbi:MAG: glucuronate isomerase [Ardenticatenales bacterium]|nr:glucuronate isomerase [Ardenticatenales bacterium]